jgi:hypothetical protein
VSDLAREMLNDTHQTFVTVPLANHGVMAQSVMLDSLTCGLELAKQAAVHADLGPDPQIVPTESPTFLCQAQVGTFPLSEFALPWRLSKRTP